MNDASDPQGDHPAVLVSSSSYVYRGPPQNAGTDPRGGHQDRLQAGRRPRDDAFQLVGTR
jgi:hypothetical protein